MRNLKSLGDYGPRKPAMTWIPKIHSPIIHLAANRAINTFSRNGLFAATNVQASSGTRALSNLMRDTRINKR